MARPALVPWSLFLLALAGAVWLTLETRSLSAELGRLEQQARTAASDEAADQSLQGENESLRASNHRLEDELRKALLQSEGVTRLVQDRVAAEEAARVGREELQRFLNAPMPEGVRLCIKAITERLRADGFQGLRFLQARSIENHELRQVDLIDADPDGLITTLYSAGRMTAVLDRVTSELVLRLFDGHLLSNRLRKELPPEGHPIVLRSVDGRAWEERLPYLVQGQGSYPVPAAVSAGADRVDLDTRLQWQDRLNLMLERSGSNSRVRVKGFRGMREGWFLEAALAGYDDKARLNLQAMVAKFCVEVDEKAGTAQLCLVDGTLLGQAGESKITAEGYRILLPDLKPAQASEAMLGMVVRR